MFLPFYILRYENEMPSAKETSKVQQLVDEYVCIAERLNDAIPVWF